MSKSSRRPSIASRILSVARAMVNCSKPEAPHMAESLSSSQQILRFGTFEVNPRSGELRKGGVRIKLHGQPFEVLAMLLERPGQVVTREELRLRLWPTDTFVNFGHGVNTAINKLRQRLRLHAQVWNAADGSTLLTVKHDSEMADLFGVQDKVADAVARTLGAEATASSEAPAAAPTKHPLASELFLRAVERLSRVNLWDTRTAIEMLEKAVKLDAGFVAAWARLAAAYMLMAVTFEPGVRWVRRGDRAIRRAL